MSKGKDSEKTKISEVRAKLKKKNKSKPEEIYKREERSQESTEKLQRALNICALGFHWRGRSFVFSFQPVRCLTWFGRNRMASFLN